MLNQHDLHKTMSWLFKRLVHNGRMKTPCNPKGRETAQNIKNSKRTQYLVETKQKVPKSEPKTNPFWTQSEPNNTQFEPNRTQSNPPSPPFPPQAEPEGVTVKLPVFIDFFHRHCVSSQGARV